MDNSEWRKWQKESWPVGSLERTLIRDYPGAKSLLDALEKTKKRRLPDVTATQVNLETTELEKYLALRENIKTIAHYIHNGFDTWSVDEATRERLARIPINSVAEALMWRDAWVKEIRKVKEQSGDSKSGED